MSALIRSELLKIRTTRGWYAYLVVIALLVGLAVAADVGTADDESRGELEFQLGLVESAGFAALLAIILGITMVTTEFRHGTITPTVLAEPRRERVLGAKALAALLAAVGLGALALAVVVAVGVPWLSAVGAENHLFDAGVGKLAAKTLLAAVLWALLGVAIGTLVHSQVAALVGTLIWVFLGETLVYGLTVLLDAEGAAEYLPFRALDAADGTGGSELLSYWPGVAVSFGWIALVGAAGLLRTQRRDLT